MAQEQITMSDLLKWAIGLSVAFVAWWANQYILPLDKRVAQIEREMSTIKADTSNEAEHRRRLELEIRGLGADIKALYNLN